MAVKNLTKFDYLLNAFEQASQADKPAKHGYAAKRKALFAHVRQMESARADLLLVAVNAVPDNWLDSLLTGPEGIGQPPYYCPDIEKLCKAIRERIRTAISVLAPKSTPEGEI